MNCPECNSNNKQREEMKDRFCGCCGGTKSISFHRFIQWNLGWVCWLENGVDASVSVMNDRCDYIIRECYRKLGKKINRTWERCENDQATPSEVTQFFCSQFLGKDCKVKNNY